MAGSRLKTIDLYACLSACMSMPIFPNTQFNFFFSVKKIRNLKIIRSEFFYYFFTLAAEKLHYRKNVEPVKYLLSRFVSYIPYCVFFYDLIFDSHHKPSHSDSREVWLYQNLTYSKQIVFGPLLL